MTHFSTNPGKVRADVFKPTGKWYETIELDMSAVWDFGLGPHDAVREALKKADHYQPDRWIIVVSEPYHRYAYPVILGPAETGLYQK